MARYLEAVQCLNLISPKRSPEALRIADARAGLRSLSEGWDSALLEIVFSVPDEQFQWFRSVLRKMAEKYERDKSIVQTYRKRLPDQGSNQGSGSTGSGNDR